MGRPLELSLSSNGLIIGLTGVAAIAALSITITSGTTDAWVAPVHTFLTWAFVREVDPDHDWTALTAGFIAGLWAIVGLETMSALALLGLMIAARLVLNSTGRRPLGTDLVALALGASAIAYNPEGWIAGFAVAVAIYVDYRLAGVVTRGGPFAAAVAALGTSVVATMTDAVPKTIPNVRPLLSVVVGVVALWAILREPMDPLSVTDSRDRRLLEARRLHGARSLVGVALFLAALLMGATADGLVPAFVGFALALVSGERDRLRRGWTQ